MRDELVRSACCGNPDARQAVGQWLTSHLATFFAKRRHTAEEIDDLTQDTMIVVWRRANEHTESNAEQFRQWVLGIGTITARARISRMAGRGALQDRFERTHVISSTASLSSQYRLAEEFEIVERYLERLPPSWRELILYVLAGGEFREYAQDKGIKTKTARRRYRDAVSRLRMIIDQERRTPARS